VQGLKFEDMFGKLAQDTNCQRMGCRSSIERTSDETPRPNFTESCPTTVKGLGLSSELPSIYDL